MFAEDLSAFFDVAGGFAVNATIGGLPVAGIFDNGYQAALGGMLENTAPTFIAPTASVSALVQGSALTINATAYKVATVQPDGTGVTTLVLELA